MNSSINGSLIARFIGMFVVTLCAVVICVTQWRISSYITAFWIPNAVLIAAWFQTTAVRPRIIALSGGLCGILCGALLTVNSLVYGLYFTGIQAIEIALTIIIIRFAIGQIIDFTKRRELLTFVVIATVIGPAIGALIGGLVIHAMSPVSYGHAVIRWFLAHLCGMLVFGTFGLSVTGDEITQIVRKRMYEALGISLLLAAATYGIFAQTTYPCLFAVFPLLIFAAFRLGFAAAAFAPLIVTAIATILTVFKSGPIYLIHSIHSNEAAIHYLQVYIVFVVLTTLPVAAVLRERDSLANQRRKNEDRIWIGEELYRQIELHALTGITIVSLQGRFLRVNPALATMFGYNEEELLAKHVAEVTLQQDISRSRIHLERLLKGEIPAYQIEKRYVRKDGSVFWALLSAALVKSLDGTPLHIVAQILDISERRAREASMQDAKETAEAALAEQHTHADRQKFINDATLLMQDSIDMHGTLDRLAHHLISRLGDLCIVATFGPPGDKTAPILGTAATSQYLLDSMSARELRRKSREELMQFFDLADNPTIDQSHGDGTIFGTYLGEQRAMLHSILHSETGIVGFVILARPASETYSASEHEKVDEIARRLQSMLEIARLFQRERKLAQELQHTMLPTILAAPNNTTVDALYIPASAESDVGGDWFDSFTLPDGRLFVSIGDVAGHGLRAAGAMGQIRLMIRAYALVDPDPIKVAAQCDRAIAYLELPTTTAIFGLYDTAVGSFIFVQAGHPAPILVTSENEVIMLDDYPRTLPLGLIEDAPIDQGLITLGHGTHLIMYTDGLIEFDRNVVTGEQILCAAVAAAMTGPASGHPAETIARNVFQGVIPRDDTAILVLSAPAPSLASLSLNAKATPVNLRVLRQRIASFAALHGVRGQSLARLEVAVGEALTNVLEHAYHFESGDIAVYGVGEVDRVWIEIADYGRWRPERDEGRGYGLSVMREFCDDVQVERDSGGTRVRLTQEVTV